MAPRLPKVRVGTAQRHQALAAFPLFSRSRGRVAYRLASDALADGWADVQEIDEEGTVALVLVDNRGPARLLFLEGEELVGAKQDRVVNTSVLVPAGRSVRLRVSCVERGRWVYRSHRLLASGRHAPTLLRSALKRSVGEGLVRDRAARSDQVDIWNNLEHLHQAYDAPAPTGALSAAFDRHGDTIASFRQALPYVDGARGLAVAVGDRITSIDLFDREGTCAAVWERLLSGAVFDAIGRTEGGTSVGPWDVKCLLNTALIARWRRVPTVGDGEEYRACIDGEPASLLCCDDIVVHESIVPA